jgi:hypothetical protein
MVSKARTSASLMCKVIRHSPGKRDQNAELKPGVYIPAVDTH